MVFKKVVFIGIFFLSLYSACKKSNQPACDNLCTCINNSSSIPLGKEDSAAFYSMILGTWYLKQENSNVKSISCKQQCYCDTQFKFIFFADKTLIMNLPGNLIDTTTYNFESDSVNGFDGYGTFKIPGNSSYLGQIMYTSNFISFQTQFSGNINVEYPATYYLTRY
jgi:hypothetical protein